MRPVLYLDTVAPLRQVLWDVRQQVCKPYTSRYLARLPLPKHAKLEHRPHDGGAFVMLPSESTLQQTKELSVALQESLEPVAWNPWRQPRCWLVKGVPWIEDMNTFPNRSLYVESPDGSIETLYSLFRPYGKIHDILPPDTKADRPECVVIFTHTRDAAAAYNTLHGYRPAIPTKDSQLAEKPLRIQYRKVLHGHAIFAWLQSHPRIVLPFLAVLLATLSYIIFDPVRVKAVEVNIRGGWNMEKYPLLRWLKKETITRLGFSSGKADSSSLSGIETEREQAVEQLKTWISDDPETFLTVIGPRGSGKTDVVRSALRNHNLILYLDAGDLAKRASTDASLVSELARQTGYKPHFSFLSTVNNWIDLASVGLIGQKAGFAESLEAQLKQVLSISASALRNASVNAASERMHSQSIARLASQVKESFGTDENGQQYRLLRHGILHDGRIDTLAGNGIMSELGFGIERDSSQYWQIYGTSSAMTAKELLDYSKASTDTTSSAPVVVLQSSAFSVGERETLALNAIMEWAAALVENKVAHVIVCSDNSQIVRNLTRALPNRPLNSITLTDANTETALQYVSSKLAGDEQPSTSKITTLKDVPETRDAIRTLGGRQSDLESLVHKLQIGMSVNEAVDEILTRSISEIRKNMFDTVNDSKEPQWTTLQAYYLATRLAEKSEIGYTDALVNGPFKGDEDALRALEQAELISIVHHEDRGQSTIKAGRPVYQEAFRKLIQDKIFSSQQKLSENESTCAGLKTEIKAAEEELVQLSQLFMPETGKWIFGSSNTIPLEVSKRVSDLLKKLGESQDKLERISAESAKLSSNLKQED